MKNAILWLWVVPLVAFGVAMLLFPKWRAAIFGVELASPVPPLP